MKSIFEENDLDFTVNETPFLQFPILGFLLLYVYHELDLTMNFKYLFDVSYLWGFLFICLSIDNSLLWFLNNTMFSLYYSIIS